MEGRRRAPDDCSSRPTTGAAGGGYGLGMIGAAVFYIQEATSFWNGALGLLKACLWPAFVVYDALKFMST